MHYTVYVGILVDVVHVTVLRHRILTTTRACIQVDIDWLGMFIDRVRGGCSASSGCCGQSSPVIMLSINDQHLNYSM